MFVCVVCMFSQVTWSVKHIFEFNLFIYSHFITVCVKCYTFCVLNVFPL